MSDLVSVITAVYNAEEYLEESIQSVLNQTHQNWELLIINDGSHDRSEEIILSYCDERIKYYKQENKGVSSARNIGLAEMQGDFFCFLDADDRLTKKSISHRLEKFAEDDSIDFVDGIVQKKDHRLLKIIDVWKPRLSKVTPFDDLIKISGKSFFGLSWMIKKVPAKKYQMKPGLTHGEDLLFYISISSAKKYDYVDEVILEYRNHKKSAMNDLKKLEIGYKEIYKTLKNDMLADSRQLKIFRKKYQSIMFKSFSAQGRFISAIRSLL